MSLRSRLLANVSMATLTRKCTSCSSALRCMKYLNQYNSEVQAAPSLFWPWLPSCILRQEEINWWETGWRRLVLRWGWRFGFEGWDATENYILLDPKSWRKASPRGGCSGSMDTRSKSMLGAKRWVCERKKKGVESDDNAKVLESHGNITQKRSACFVTLDNPHANWGH